MKTQVCFVSCQKCIFSVLSLGGHQLPIKAQCNVLTSISVGGIELVCTLVTAISQRLC